MFSIMVVEDDNNTRRLTADVLEENGYKAITAKNGREALEIMDEKHIDLIIMDVMMPEMDGYELTSQLRRAECNIPILMVMAKEALSDKRRASEQALTIIWSSLWMKRKCCSG